MKHLLLLALFGVTLTQSLHAQAGTTGLSFLKLGVGARSIGMGEAYSALADDPSATFYNPAGLSLNPTSQILLMHKSWFQGTRIEYIAAKTSSGQFAFGVSANATSVDDIELRSVPGPALGTFDARNASMGLSIAYAPDTSLSIGVTGKYLYEKILVYDASGLGFDIGGIYKTPWNVRFALAVNNLGSVNALENESSKLPTLIRAGAAYETQLESIDGTLIVASDLLSYTAEQTTHLHVGAELDFKRTFALRAGFQTGYEARNFSGGFGVHCGLIRLDYAFVPFRYDLGSTHTFSLGIGFR